MAIYRNYDQQELDNQYTQNYWVSDPESAGGTVSVDSDFTTGSCCFC